MENLNESFQLARVKTGGTSTRASRRLTERGGGERGGGSSSKGGRATPFSHGVWRPTVVRSAYPRGHNHARCLLADGGGASTGTVKRKSFRIGGKITYVMSQGCHQRETSRDEDKEAQMQTILARGFVVSKFRQVA